MGTCGLAWALALASLVLLGVNRDAPDSLAYWVMDVVSALAYGLVVWLMLPRSRHPVAWILVLVAVGCGLSALVAQLALLGLAHGAPPQLVGLLVTAGSWVWVPGTLGSMAVLPWLVVPGRRPPWTRVVLAVAVAAIVVATLATALSQHPYVDNPLAIAESGSAVQRVFHHIGAWPQRLCVVIGFAGAGWLLVQRRRLRGDAGRGLGWLVVGELFMNAAFVPVVFLLAMGPLMVEVSGLALVVAQLFLPAALLVVVLGQQLWGVDVTVSRVTLWALLTGALVIGYSALAWGLGHLLPGSRQVAGLLAVGLVTALGQPLRHWLQARVDSLVYGQGADPVRLLRALDRDEPTGRRTSLESLVDALRRGLRLGGVQVRSVDGHLVVGSGRLAPDVVAVPLQVEGRRLGELVASAPPGQRVDDRTSRQIEQMRGVIGVALELAQANQRLEAATDRLLEVRMEERRMLRRDLHDGMGPALAGVGLGLAAAQRRLRHDPDGTAELLAELATEVERRTDDVRLLARAMLPAQLDDGDLGDALAVLAARFAGSGLDVRVDSEHLGRVDTRHQLATYHVAAEAVVNAYRHAGCTRVDVSVATTPDGVVLSVVDDGTGIPDQHRPGVGLRSMRERASELGGSLEVGAGPGGRGTVVRMVLP